MVTSVQRLSLRGAKRRGNLPKHQHLAGITKTALAVRTHTSRAQFDRILNAKGNITIETLQRVATLLGRELRVELV
jgi:transcriptional regulator with XRE-family HTH domain